MAPLLQGLGQPGDGERQAIEPDRGAEPRQLPPGAGHPGIRPLEAEDDQLTQGGLELPG